MAASRTSPAFATKTIDPKDAPKFWFIETVADPKKGYPEVDFYPISGFPSSLGKMNTPYPERIGIRPVTKIFVRNFRQGPYLLLIMRRIIKQITGCLIGKYTR